jgi:hypothetical protein
MVFLVPPTQAPDERYHAVRSFHLSRGRLFPDGVVNGVHGGRVPAGLLELNDTMVHRSPGVTAKPQLTADEYRHFFSIRLKTDTEQTADFGYLCYSCFVPYLPQAAGIYLVRKLDGSLLTAFYAGRLANLLVSVLALSLALRLMPFYKNVLGAVALLPVSVQQMATLSADALGIATCFLFTALVFRLIVPSDRRPGALLLLGLCGSGVLLPICKIPFALLTLLYLGVSPARLGSWRKYLLVGAALAAMTILGAYVTVRSSEGATRLGEGIPLPEVSRSRQLEYVAHHPEAFLKALGRTCACWGWLYCEQLAIVGSLNVVVAFLPAKAYLLFVALVALLDRRAGWRPSPRLQLLAAAVAVLGFTLFHLMLYLVWTMVAGPVIEGFQGRYFLGFLPVALLAFYSPAVRARCAPGALLGLTAAAAVGVQLATLHAVLAAFYFTPEPSGAEPGAALVPLASGGLFLAALLALEWRARAAEGRLTPTPPTAA